VSYFGVIASLAIVTLPPTIHAQVIAYRVTAGTVGNQDAFGSALGMDFNVITPIVVTRLGVFDSGSNGLAHFLTAQIYNRDTQAPVTPLITFAAGSGAGSGTLIDGSRFLDITALTLLAGFHGSIVASHWDSAEPNYNSFGVPNTTATTDTGGGAISFAATGRFSGGPPDVFPTFIDNGPANRYDAGTFTFTPVPEPSGLALAGIGATYLLALRRRRNRANAPDRGVT
jgi:hypothetical protein